MKHICRVSFLLAALSVLGVGKASADTLLSYTFSGPISVSFELPVNPTVISFNTGLDFQVTPVDLMINGVASGDTLVFYSSALGGAFDAISSPSTFDAAFAGPQLYSGPESAPTMLAMSGVSLMNDIGGTPAGTLTTTTTSTPEPSAIVLLAVGLIALLGYAFFSKRINRLSLAVN